MQPDWYLCCKFSFHSLNISVLFSVSHRKSMKHETDVSLRLKHSSFLSGWYIYSETSILEWDLSYRSLFVLLFEFISFSKVIRFWSFPLLINNFSCKYLVIFYLTNIINVNCWMFGWMDVTLRTLKQRLVYPKVCMKIAWHVYLTYM